MEPKDEEEKKRSTEELVNSFFQYMMLKMELVYGNAHTEWWNTNGRNLFFAWAKQRGIEFTDNDFDRTPPFLQKLDEEAVTVVLCKERYGSVAASPIDGLEQCKKLAKAICKRFGTPKIEDTQKVRKP